MADLTQAPINIMDYYEWKDEIARSGWSFGLSKQKVMIADWRTDRANWRANRDKWKAEAERLDAELETLKQNVKEHATLSAGAGVDHGVEVENT